MRTFVRSGTPLLENNALTLIVNLQIGGKKWEIVKK